jgi:hypothetical protein
VGDQQKDVPTVMKTNEKPIGVWLRDGSLIYRLAATPFGLSNCDEIDVSQVAGSRALPARIERAEKLIAHIEMAEEYQRWIDYFHKGGDYDGFLRAELRGQKGGEA